MNRRNFLTLFSVSLFASCSPLLFAASYAAESKLKSKKNPSKSKRWISVGTVEELDKAGQILKEESSNGPILVIGTSKSKNLIAVNPTCTHLGCTVDWEAEENIFLCPCHASEFTTDGKIQMGPAAKPLSTYEAKILLNRVMVRPV